MSVPTLRELGAIVRAAEIVSPTQLRFAGRPFQAPPQQPAAPRPGQPPKAQQAGPPPVVTLLQNTLYQYCYVRPFTGAAVDPPYQAAEGDELTAALSRANAGRERWEAGWSIEQILPSGQILAKRYDARRFLWPGEFVSRDGPGIQPRPGLQVSVFLPRESATMQPGFHFVFGEAVADQGDELDLVRLYWNVTADGAPVLTNALTTALNRFAVPFRFKTLSHRAAYGRTDSAVLYVSRRYFRIAAELVVEAVLPALAGVLGSGTPLFSKRLAPGVGLAEDPRSGESFGMSRCRLLAEAVWHAGARGVHDHEARLRFVVKYFQKRGCDLKQPYLNPGSVDRYELPVLV